MTGSTDTWRRLCRPQPVWWTLITAVALTGIGIAAINTVKPGYAMLQARWLVISLAVAAFCAMPNPRVIARTVFPLCLATLALLVLLLLPFVPRSIVPVRNGATCWINLQVMMLQPAEIAKTVFILALALYLRYRDSYRTLRGLMVPFVLMFLPVLLILNQPDLGTAVLFVPALFVMLVAAGARLGHLGMLIGLAVLAVVINIAIIYTLPPSMQLLKDHQRQRIVSMISLTQGDSRYNNDIGYQQDKAMTLVGSGGLHGFGGHSRTILRFNRLPESHNDMIFAVIMNRWGLVGGLTVLGLYLVLIVSLLSVAGNTKDPFARLATVGFAGLLFTQTVINIGMTLGLLPITGITLPFVSYGGSSLVATYAILGLTINFAVHRPVTVSPPSFEFDRVEAIA